MLLMPLARAAEWQWSVPMGTGRAFLWIPPTCAQVRAVILAQNNLLEEPILEAPSMRQTLGELGVAEILVAPPFDPVFRFDRGAGTKVNALLEALSRISGYDELAAAPVIPIGHSACASYPWNFAAWAPQRTLAILSVKGDAPETNLTGSGHANPPWGNRSIDGIPALMVMGEYEWWDARLAPALAFRARHPGAPIAFLADAGHGHFDAFPALVDFLAGFIRKAVAARLPRAAGKALVPVDPRAGWLVDHWRGDAPLRARAAPFSAYAGDRNQAFWCFDGEMARATEAYYAAERGKRPQQVDFVQDRVLAPISNAHAGVFLPFRPDADGVTFHLRGEFIHPLPAPAPLAAKDKAPPQTATTPVVAAADEHAEGAVHVNGVVGPIAQLDASTFRVALDRTFSTGDRRSLDAWLLAWNPGDRRYKSAEQQAYLRLPLNRAGRAQRISFALIADQRIDAKSLQLSATSSAGAKVRFYVREGPAEISGDTLTFTPIPPRARFPVRVTVVAWQFGRSGEPKLQAATPVERTFQITKR